MEVSRIRVLIADDVPRTRAGLRALLAIDPEIEVVGEAADGQAAVRLAEEHQPDVVLMDVRMPGMGGLEATRIIKARWPAVKVIVLTIYAAYRDDALAAGADAFVRKGNSSEHLLAVLRTLGADDDDGNGMK